MSITLEQTKLAYDVSKSYYNGHIKRQYALSQLNQTGMNPGTAAIYLQVYQHLRDGESFSRTLKAESFDYFLKSILEDFGSNQLFKALDSLRMHIEYYESTHIGKLNMVRELHRKYLDIYNNIESDIADEEEETSFPEGKVLFRLHKTKERNAALIKAAKLEYQVKNKKLSCQVCDFSFEEEYGEYGRGYIEAHHIFPISELKEETNSLISDLVFVCSNCHKMLHRRRPWIGIEDLKKLRNR